MRSKEFFVKFYFFLNSMRLRDKIFLTYAFLILITMSTTGYLIYTQTAKTADEQVLNSLTQSMTQTGKNIDDILRKTEKDINLFSTSPMVQDILMDYDSKSASDQYDGSMRIKQLISSFEQSSSIYEIRIFFNNSKRFLSDNEKIFSDFSQLDNKILEEIKNESNMIFTNSFNNYSRGSKESTYSYIKPLVDINEYNNLFGIVVFSINEDKLENILENLKQIKSSNVYLISDNSYLISYATSQKYPKIDKKLLGKASSGTIESETTIIEEKRYLRVLKKVDRYGIYIVDDVSMEEITRRSKEILNRLILITTVALLLSFITAFFISEGITNRIERLAKRMTTVDIDNLNSYQNDNYNDEIGALARSFNKMTNRITILIRDMNKVNIEKKEADLRLLQAQINPHFLYNTLNIINWLASKSQEKEICYIVSNLSDFLRFGLNKGGRMSTVEKELRHIYSYFNIQKYRFEDRIELVVDVPDELFQVKIISLTFQPLIENCILHGILQENNRKGIIKIEGKVFEDTAIIEISDNGIGMEDGKLRSVIKGLSDLDEQNTGFGLRNVHQRLKITYGEEYGLNIESLPGSGIKFIILLPMTLLP